MKPIKSARLAAWILKHLSFGPKRPQVRRWTSGRVRRAIQTLFLALSVFSSAQIQSADTPAREQFRQWLAAFNGNDREAYRQYLQKSFPSGAGRVDQDWRVRANSGGFEAKKLSDDGATKVTAQMQEQDSEMFGQVTLEVEAVAPHRIVKMEMRPIGHPAEFTVPHMSDAELIAALRKRVDESVAADKFAGAVLIMKDGKPIFTEAYGLADRERKIPNTVKTRFRIGSMNKMFTAVAILQLVQAGKLGLNDPLGKYLTDYPNKDLASKVTISELLSHTGGTGDFFGPEFDKHRLELKTHEDYVKLYGSRPVRFEPGSRFEYSNYGFLLLGNVIEKVSGQSYYDYVQEHIYKPAGMTSTGSEPEGQAVSDLSVGYTKMGTDKWHPNTDFLPYRGTSAGGGYTTVGDLEAFANALRGNKLLNPYYTSLLTTGKVAMPGGYAHYAYGFEETIVDGSKCVGHGGGSPGMNGELEMCLDSRYVVVALANLDPPAAMRVSDFVMYRLPAQESK